MAICKSKKAPEDLEDQSLRGGSKMSVQQGHSHFCARNVPAVREYGKRATCLREAAPAKAGNAAGGFFQQTLPLKRSKPSEVPLCQMG